MPCDNNSKIQKRLCRIKEATLRLVKKYYIIKLLTKNEDKA